MLPGLPPPPFLPHPNPHPTPWQDIDGNLVTPDSARHHRMLALLAAAQAGPSSHDGGKDSGISLDDEDEITGVLMKEQGSLAAMAPGLLAALSGGGKSSTGGPQPTAGERPPAADEPPLSPMEVAPSLSHYLHMRQAPAWPPVRSGLDDWEREHTDEHGIPSREVVPGMTKEWEEREGRAGRGKKKGVKRRGRKSPARKAGKWRAGTAGGPGDMSEAEEGEVGDEGEEAAFRDGADKRERSEKREEDAPAGEQQSEREADADVAQSQDSDKNEAAVDNAGRTTERDDDEEEEEEGVEEITMDEKADDLARNSSKGSAWGGMSSSGSSKSANSNANGANGKIHEDDGVLIADGGLDIPVDGDRGYDSVVVIDDDVYVVDDRRTLRPTEAEAEAGEASLSSLPHTLPASGVPATSITSLQGEDGEALGWDGEGAEVWEREAEQHEGDGDQNALADASTVAAVTDSSGAGGDNSDRLAVLPGTTAAADAPAATQHFVAQSPYGSFTHMLALHADEDLQAIEVGDRAASLQSPRAFVPAGLREAAELAAPGSPGGCSDVDSDAFTISNVDSPTDVRLTFNVGLLNIEDTPATLALDGSDDDLDSLPLERREGRERLRDQSLGRRSLQIGRHGGEREVETSEEGEVDGDLQSGSDGNTAMRLQETAEDGPTVVHAGSGVANAESVDSLQAQQQHASEREYEEEDARAAATNAMEVEGEDGGAQEGTPDDVDTAGGMEGDKWGVQTGSVDAAEEVDDGEDDTAAAAVEGGEEVHVERTEESRDESVEIRGEDEKEVVKVAEEMSEEQRRLKRQQLKRWKRVADVMTFGLLTW